MMTISFADPFDITQFSKKYYYCPLKLFDSTKN